MRAVVLFLFWWLVIGFWTTWDSLGHRFEFDSFTKLAIAVSFIYTLLPLGVALLVALVSAHVFRFTSFLRSCLCGCVCGGIALVFFVETGQLDTYSLIFVGVSFIAGASLGWAARAHQSAPLS
jgi:hypothetical protein